MGILIDMKEWREARRKPETAEEAAQRLADEARVQLRIAAYTKGEGSRAKVLALRAYRG